MTLRGNRAETCVVVHRRLSIERHLLKAITARDQVKHSLKEMHHDQIKMDGAYDGRLFVDQFIDDVC